MYVGENNKELIQRLFAHTGSYSSQPIEYYVRGRSTGPKHPTAAYIHVTCSAPRDPLRNAKLDQYT